MPGTRVPAACSDEGGGAGGGAGVPAGCPNPRGGAREGARDAAITSCPRAGGWAASGVLAVLPTLVPDTVTGTRDPASCPRTGGGAVSEARVCASCPKAGEDTVSGQGDLASCPQKAPLEAGEALRVGSCRGGAALSDASFPPEKGRGSCPHAAALEGGEALRVGSRAGPACHATSHITIQGCGSLLYNVLHDENNTCVRTAVARIGPRRDLRKEGRRFAWGAEPAQPRQVTNQNKSEIQGSGSLLLKVCPGTKNTLLSMAMAPIGPRPPEGGDVLALDFP